MRTPWKMLYDWTILGQEKAVKLSNNSYSAIKLGELIFVVLVSSCMVGVIFAVRTFCALIGAQKFVSYLDSHFWQLFIGLFAAFFFYYFFRLVWDGLKETMPTSDLPNEDDSAAADKTAPP